MASQNTGSWKSLPWPGKRIRMYTVHKICVAQERPKETALIFENYCRHACSSKNWICSKSAPRLSNVANMVPTAVPNVHNVMYCFNQTNIVTITNTAFIIQLYSRRGDAAARIDWLCAKRHLHQPTLTSTMWRMLFYPLQRFLEICGLLRVAMLLPGASEMVHLMPSNVSKMFCWNLWSYNRWLKALERRWRT